MAEVRVERCRRGGAVNGPGVLACGAAVAALLTSAVVGVGRLGASSALVEERQGELEELRRLEVRAAELRGRRPRAVHGGRPKDDLVGLANRVLRDAGLPESALREIVPEAEAPAPGRTGSARVQRARLSFDGLRVTDSGALLDRWRSLAAPWTIVSLELRHTGSEREPEARFSLRMTVEAVYLDGGADGTLNQGVRPR